MNQQTAPTSQLPTIVSVVANTPSGDGTAKFSEWRLGMPIPSDADVAPVQPTPGRDAIPGHVSTTYITKILDMGNQVDFYVLPKIGGQINQSGPGIIFSIPAHNVHQITRAATIDVWTATMENAEAQLLEEALGEAEESDEDEDEDDAEIVPQAPPPQAAAPVVPVHSIAPIGLPDPALFATAGVSSATNP